MTENEQVQNEIGEKNSPEKSNSTEQNNQKDEEISELKKTFTEIIIHFSDFLSKHSVYEAAPENSKVLVFNSDLSFKEMVKAFINEDIYCALIYDSEKEYFIGLITISDILLLFKYIIEQTQQREITDYNIFIEEIFSTHKKIKFENKDNNNSSKKDKNFDILKYLTKINFNDYWAIIKKKKKIYNLISISLDASLFDVLKMIYKVGVHRLVVEETKKKNLADIKKKESDANNEKKIEKEKTEKEKEKNEKIEKEKIEKIEKEKNEKEKSEKAVSEKKIKKVKTKKKSEENVGKEEETKEGEKKVKKKKVKKKKTEDEETKEKEDKEKEKEKIEIKEKEDGGEKSEKTIKKVKVKKTKVKKKKLKNQRV